MSERPPGIVSRTLARFGRMLASLSKVDDGGAGPGWILHDTATYTPSGAVEVNPTPEGLFKLFVENLWVYTSITTNARAIAGAPWNLKRWNESTGQGDIVADHPMIDLLEKPYPGATYETLIQTINPHLDLAGNAYAEEVAAEGADEKEARGPVLELRPLLPTKMRTIIHPREGVEQYLYKPNMVETPLSPDEVIHFILQDPRSEVSGVGPASAAWLTARIDNEALRWNAGFFRRGATPGVVLETPEKIPAAERLRIVAEFDQKFGGTDKAHKTACLPYGLKATPFGQTMREMQFRELRRMTREEIMAAFGTPPILAGILDGASFSNAYLQLQIFRDYHVLPRLRYVFAMLTAALAPRYEDGEGLYLEPDVSEMRLPDEEDRELTRAVQLVQAGIVDVAEARAMIGLAAKEPDDEAVATGTIFAYDQENAVLTIDEIRGTKNLPPHPNREFGPLTVPELKAKHPEMFAPGGGAPPMGGGGGFGKSVNHTSRGTGRTWFSRLAKNAPHLVAVEKRRTVIVPGWAAAPRQPASGTPARRSEFAKGEDGASDDGASDEDGGAPVTPWRMAKARDFSISRRESATTKLIGAWLDRQKSKVLALVRSKLHKAEDAAPKVDITEEELREVLAEPLTRAIQDALRQGMGDGGEDTARGMDVEFGVPNDAVTEYLEERTTNLERVLGEDTARMVKDSLDAGYKAGENALQLTERIAESGAFAQSRAQRIARTELHAAHGAGSFAQMRASGATKKRWVASPDQATRPSHQEASGQVVDLEDAFQVGDSELMYPGDPDGPPEEIISCRCVMVMESVNEPDDVDALTEDLSGDDDAVDQARDAVRALPDDVLGRIDARAMSRLTVDRGRGADVDYDADERTLTVGPKARRRDVQDGIKEHLVATVTTATDARGFHNARTLSKLPDAKGGAEYGTERERTVALVSRAATGDRAGLESLVGRDLTDGEWKSYQVLAANFVAGFGARGPKPARR